MLHTAVMSFPWLTGAGGVVLVLMTSEFLDTWCSWFCRPSANPGCTGCRIQTST